MLNISSLVNLTNFNTLHLNSIAKQYIVINDLHQLPRLTQHLQKSDKFFVLGGGSNILLPEYYDGLVIHNKLKGISIENITQDSILVKAMAGEIWDDFIGYCLNNNAYGLENLSLIPGTVGAAPIQNIGAYGVEVKDFISSVQVYDLQQSKYLDLTNRECKFEYRNSKLKNNSRYIVVSVNFRLNRQTILNSRYGDVQEYLTQIKNPTPADLRNIIIKIRQSKLPDYKILPNVGSFFHNPVVNNQEAAALKIAFTKLPVFLIDDQYSKLSAGWLIDNLGLKGHREGNLGVYDKQALVLVNYGTSSRQEVLNFANTIQTKVLEKYNIQLSIEPILL